MTRGQGSVSALAGLAPGGQRLHSMKLAEAKWIQPFNDTVAAVAAGTTRKRGRA